MIASKNNITIVFEPEQANVVSSEIKFAPVGKGNLPPHEYIEELKKYCNGPLIMHGLAKNDIDFAIKYLNHKN